jgi:hypothetical protein
MASTVRIAGERKAPTHAVYAETATEVVFTLPRQDVPRGDDRVRVTVNDESVVMAQQDWQQFVACVLKADEQVRHIFDRAGRPLGLQP